MSRTDAASPPDSPSWRALLVVFGGLVCQMGLGFNYVFGALAPNVIADLDWTKAEFSGARAPQLWVMALGSPLVGFLTVRFGARGVLAFSTTLLGVSFLLLGRMDALWQLYALLSLQALAVTGLGDITVGQAVAGWVGRHRGLALGVVYTGSNIGGALLVRSAGFAAAPDGWRSVFAAMGWGALLVMLPIALLAIREPPRRRETSPALARDVGGADDLDLRQAVRTRSFWILGAALFAFFFYFVAVLDHLVLYLGENGFSDTDARAHLANAILLGLVTKVGFGWIADRMRARSAILVDFGLLAGSASLLLLPPTPATVWLFVVVFGFAAPARDVVYPLALAHCFGVRSLAQIYGALMLALPAGALGAFFAAWVSDRYGSYDRAFAVFVVLNLVAFASLALLRDERRAQST